MLKKNGYSLCTVVYGRKLSKFRECVGSWIDNKNTDDFEINISCNGLDEDLVKYFSDLEKKYDFINVFYFSKNLGAAKGLNTSFLASKYRYIVKLDDDIIIPNANKDWLQKLSTCLDSDHRVDIVTGVCFAAGPVMPYTVKKLGLEMEIEKYIGVPFEKFDMGYRNGNFLKFNEEMKIRIEEHAQYLRENNDGYQHLHQGLLRMMGCLMMTYHETFRVHGVLKENFGLHGQDDIEFDRRLRSHGREDLTDTSLYYYHWV